MFSRQLDEEAIFHVARKLADPEDRDKYLDQVCAGDQALRERVEALLDIHGREENFLRSSPESAATVDHTSLTECPGATVGRYKLMEQIGEGGMGAVFVAAQERPIRRKVALKVIKPGMDSKAVVARFEAERQALAMMDHPNIAKVLDAGTTESGRPYFAMELVKGLPITEYCDRNRLAIRERLALFVQVCHAIQHAHQKGIIHRDIKPSNVLITLHDGQPVPKVIDFGVAKALNARLTDKTIYTEHLQVVGTLLYMSPEQAELSGLDVDTRSDIYSLGVLLYELLTGTTPFQKDELDKAGFDEQRRIIREREPMRLSVRVSSLGEKATLVAEHRNSDPKKLHQLLQGDLDWIVLKALEKDRTRRFETANVLAADIERHLKDEPVEARPPSTLYRFRKFARRNKTGLAVSIIVAVSLITSLLLVIGRNRDLAKAFQRLEDRRVALHEANRQLTATLLREHRALADLEHHTYLGLFETALAGNDVSDELESLKNGLTEAHRLVLTGLIARNNGMMDAAADDFRQAAELDKDSLYLRALALHLLIMTGDEEEYRRQLSEFEGRVPVTYEDKMFLGHVLTYSDPRRGAQLIREAIEERNSLFAQECLAELSSHVALNENNLEEAINALKIARAINVLEPNRPEFQMILLWTLELRIQMERLRGMNTSDLESEARTIACFLGKFDDYAMGRLGAANFFELVGEEQRAEAELEAASRSGSGFYLIPLASVKFRQGEMDEALHLFKEGSKDSLFGRIVFSESLVIDQPHEAAKLYNEVKTARPPSDSERNQWIIPESIWLAAGDLERARAYCRERLRQNDYVAEWERARLEFVVREDTAEAMEAFLACINPEERPSQLQLSSAYRLAGVKYYAEGDIDKAIRYLRAARYETAVFFWPLAYWSDALARHLERKRQAPSRETQE